MVTEAKSDVTFEANKKTEAEKKLEVQGIPIYLDTLILDEDQKKRLIEQAITELNIIRKERKSIDLDARCEALDNQYNGKVTEDEMQQFNLNRNVTKVKVDAIVTAAKSAFFEADPIFAITPRPDFGKETGVEVCNKQQDFLDQKLDQLPFEPEMDLVFHSATVKGLGWLELFYDIKRESRRREERYETKLVPVVDPATKQPLRLLNGQPVVENQGLKDFLSNWPDARKDYPGYVKKLMEGGDIEFVADYKETTYNDPRPKYHDIKDVFVRIKTDGYEGLKTTRLIAIRENYTYWELKREEDDNKFYDINKLVEEKDKDGNATSKKVENFESLDFDVWKCTFYFKLKENDADEVKIVFWFVEDKKVVIGSMLYQYYAVPCTLIPFYVKRKVKGLYQPGVAEDLTDNNLAENAILNLTLQSAWLKNTVTPITSNSEVQAQFLEKRFYPGVPLNAKSGDVDFLQKYMPQVDLNGLVGLMQYLVQGDEQVSRVSSGMSGGEAPMDPNAPARKTLALLAESGKGVMDYIKHLIPSFNEVGYILLAMYYQMSKQGRAYTVRPENRDKGDEFGKIERNDMVARTNIMAKAFAFEQDKVNEKILDLALYQTVRQEPLVAKNPEAVYTLLINLVQGWSKKWKNIANKVIPTLDEFKKAELEATLQGVMMFVQGVMERAKVTGTPPEFDARQLISIVADLRAQLVTPPDPEVVKEQKKEAKRG